MSKQGNIIDAKTVARVAHLARLRLSEAEKETLAEDLRRILSDFQVIESLDTREVAPAYQPHDAAQSLRADAVQDSEPAATWLSLGGDSKDDCWLAPKVVEE